MCVNIESPVPPTHFRRDIGKNRNKNGSFEMFGNSKIRVKNF